MPANAQMTMPDLKNEVVTPSSQIGRRAAISSRMGDRIFVLRALRWRKKAEELRSIAGQVKNPLAQRSFRHMAVFCDDLAHGCEEQATVAEARRASAGSNS
jgi:hypothetical protein